MILVVSGWRDWRDGVFVAQTLRPYLLRYQQDLHVRVGGAPGVDTIVEHLLLPRNHHGATCTVYRADWSLPGRSGGPIRNGEMLRGTGSHGDPTAGQMADRLLAFPQPFVKWRSPGSGTVGCMIEAFLLGIRIDVPGYKGDQWPREEEHAYQGL